VSELVTIRGAVAAVEYEATLIGPSRSPREGQELEWHVTATGIHPFAIVARHSLIYQEPARAVIEWELERRLRP
jgi:hypothetical protein